MQTILKKISEIKPYERNTKKHDSVQINNVAESIKQYGFVQPLVVDKENVIVIGHCRYEAAKRLKMKEVPCVCVDDLTTEQVNALRIVDNKSNESDWDLNFLKDELEDVDLSMFDFDFGLDNKDEDTKEYTEKVNVPQYEVQGECPKIYDLYNDEKEKQLAEEISASNLSNEEKEFLLTAAKRHIVFDYRAIAEYYASASAEMQELMEKSALVIIDYENAIAGGYVKLSKKLEELRDEYA